MEEGDGMIRGKGISGSTLKMIAVVSMTIDHTAATILARYLVSGGLSSQGWYDCYRLMRGIGRIAFPIYCFLLIEGFLHTSNRTKYAGRLLLFAAISEIPFDMAFSGKILEFSYQNVFFTLFIGLLTIMLIAKAERQQTLGPALRSLCFVGIMFGGMGCATLLRTDYSYYGVMCIVVLYLFRQNRLVQVLAGCASFCWWELPAVTAFIPVYFYNGKRGLRMKYFFYFYYPVHLFILCLICAWLGTGQVSVI